MAHGKLQLGSIRRGADVLVADVFQTGPKEQSTAAAQQMATLAALCDPGSDGITIAAMEALNRSHFSNLT